MPKSVPIETLIGRSSLGTRAARSLRRRAPPELVDRALARSDALFTKVRGNPFSIGHRPEVAPIEAGAAKEPSVSDDLTKRKPQDASRISLTEPWEVRYWCEALNCTPEQLAAAVRAVGHSAAAVRKHLGR